MPIYEYQCSACGHYKAILQNISDAPLVECPECGKQTFAKQISASAFHLKGGGWYTTEYTKGQQDKSTASSATSDSTSSSTENAVKTTPPASSE